MQKLRVGILFGGRSGEHEVSLLSAASVLNAIDKNKYEVVPIGITKEGRWVTAGDAEQLLKGEAAGQSHLRAGDPDATSSAAVLAHGEAVIVPPEPQRNALSPFQTDALTRRASDRAINVDVIFPVLHGTFGEDGTIQGLLELADLPYVGAGVLGSAAGMDKDVMKSLFRAAGLPNGGGYATARGMVAFYQMLGHGGRLGTTRLFSPRLIAYVSRSHTGESPDHAMTGIPMHRGLGPHVRGDSDRIRGLGTIGAPVVFGHGGVGSSYSWADPSSGVSLTYLTNFVSPDPWHSARLDRVANLVHAAID